jgi:hypothetical protein
LTAGGGGGGSYGTYSDGAAGAGGVVFIRILTSLYSGTYTGSPTVYIDGAYTILRFGSSGSYTA